MPRRAAYPVDRRTRASRRYRELCKEMFVMRQTVAGIARVPPVARERGGFSPPAQDGIHKSARTAQTTAHPHGGRPTKAAMTRTPFLFAVVSLALLATEIPAGAAVRLDRAERAAIRHINAFRAAQGRPPVHPARSLNRSAEAHSTDMARRNFFAHTSSDGTPFDVRIRRYIGRGAVGETLAWHTRTRRIARSSCGCGSTRRRTARSCSRATSAASASPGATGSGRPISRLGVSAGQALVHAKSACGFASRR